MPRRIHTHRAAILLSWLFLLGIFAIGFLLSCSGCGNVHFLEIRPDGTRIEADGSHLFTNPTITGARVATTQGTVQLDGFKSEAQMTVMDILKAAAVLAGKPAP